MGKPEIEPEQNAAPAPNNAPWVSFGIVVIIDALGTSLATIEEAQRFIRTRDTVLKQASESWNERFWSSQRNYASIRSPDTYTFGDTILLFWEIKEEDLDELLPVVGWWLARFFESALMSNIYFRGAMSIGEFIEDSTSNTVIGPAVADAAAWFEAADWIGVIATPACGFYLSKMATVVSAKSERSRHPFEYDLMLVQYDVPMKSGVTTRLWAVNWALYFSLQTSLLEQDASLYLSLRGQPVPRGTEQKYANLLAFYRHVKQESAARIEEYWSFDEPDYDPDDLTEVVEHPDNDEPVRKPSE